MMRELTLDQLRFARTHGDELVTIDEAATELGVAPRTVRTWVQRGNLASTLVKGRRCVLLGDASSLEYITRDTAARPGRARRDMWGES